MPIHKGLPARSVIPALCLITTSTMWTAIVSTGSSRDLARSMILCTSSPPRFQLKDVRSIPSSTVEQQRSRMIYSTAPQGVERSAIDGFKHTEKNKKLALKLKVIQDASCYGG